MIYTVSQSDNRSVSLSMVVENKRKMNEWSSWSRFVAYWFWEGLWNENHWTDLVLFFQSHKYPLQFTILAHSINYSVFVSINDPFYVQHVPYHSSHSLQSDICRIAHLFSVMNDWNRVRLRYHNQSHSYPFPFSLIQFSIS